MGEKYRDSNQKNYNQSRDSDNDQIRSSAQRSLDTKQRELGQDEPIIIPPYAKEELEARWDQAGIENDYIFAVVMQDAGLFLQLMQRILPELHLTHVIRHERQKVEYGAPDAKSVRYDVFSEINGIHFVVEMQMHSSPSLRRRTRYYQSLLDIQNLKPGAPYRNLPDTFVIMICPFDLFKRGKHIYRFRYLEISDPTLELEDGADKIFINTKGTADDIGPDLQNFLDLINGKAPADSYCQQVADSVYAAKHSKEVKRMFMNVNIKQMEELYYAKQEAAAQGRAEGRAEGRTEEQQNSLRMLCNMVACGDLSVSAAVKNAAKYGITDEADLRTKAQMLGIKI